MARDRFAAIVTGSCALVVAGGGATMLAALGARWHWRLDLLTHFPVQITLGLLPPCTILLVLRRWRLACLAIVLLAVQFSRIVPFYLPRGSQEQGPPDLRGVSANLLHSNGNPEPFLRLVDREDADLIVAMELSPRWQSQLEPLENRYPHRVVQTRTDAFGIGLFSRLPILDSRIEWLGGSEAPAIVATLERGGQRLTVFAVHTLPPVSREYAERRDRQLAAAAKLAAGLPTPLILLGDLNTTSWSPGFADLIRESGLRDSRRGRGLQPSWPSLPWPARIPIDHLLVSPEIGVAERSLGPPIGSDHRPVLFGVRLPERGWN